MLRKIISFLEFLVGLSAIAGGYGLITTNGLGMPVVWLKDSVFTSFIYPGIVLLFIVGGTYIISAVCVWKKKIYMNEAQIITGFALMIWIFTEMYIIKQPHILQVVYFGIGILTVLSGFLLQKNERKI